MNETAEKVYTMLSLDRARKRWRLLAVVALLAVLFLTFTTIGSHTGAPVHNKDHVAVVQVDGFISDTRHQLAVLEDIAKNPKVKALLVHVDSPGGTMVGGLNLYRALREVAVSKPVVVSMGTIAASAGYLIALGADHIVASEATLTGSIGVFMPLVDATELADKIGVKSDTVASGNMKTVTSPLQTRTAQDRAYLQTMVNDLEGIFMDYVTTRRQITGDTAKLIRDGRTIIGARAHELGLVDALGGPATARAWLASAHDIGADVPSFPYALEEPLGFLQRTLSQAGVSLGHLWQAARPASAVWAVQP